MEGMELSMSDRLCIDLCCGRKGFSRAFLEAGWEVVTVDIDPKYSPTLAVDVTTLTFETLCQAARLRNVIDYEKVVVVNSPPCNSTSKANADKWLRNLGMYLRVHAACADLTYAVIHAREWYGAYFVIEQPNGRAHWFYGRPDSIVRLRNYGKPTSKPTDLWHNIPFEILQSDRDVPSKEGKHNSRREIWMSDIERDAGKRAEMPLGLSQAILDAVEPSPTVSATTRGGRA